MLIVDAHEDLAYNALTFGRDYRRSALEIRKQEVGSWVPEVTGQCTLGIPEWLDGGVAVIFSTLWTLPARRSWHPALQSYRDPDEAHRQAMAQLDWYHRWADEDERIALIRSQTDLDQVLSTWQNGSQAGTEGDDRRQVGFVILMEGADPIRTPAELPEWVDRGVRIIGLSWGATRYAGGTGEPGPLTDLGRELLDAMADLGLILDLSHAAEESFFEALDRYEGPVIASHANPRRRVPGDRQLSDVMIRYLAERDGVVGIALYNAFLRRDWSRTDPPDRVTVMDVVGAIDTVCQLVGDARHVGLGTDLDGGFGAESTPAGLDTVADLPRIAEALGEYGYQPADVEAIMGENWLRILRSALP